MMGEKSIEARLLSRMRQRADSGRIPRRDTDGPVPLSFAQQRLWFLDQLEPGGAEYLLPFGMHVTGPLDVPALESALSGLVARHEVLRTRFEAAADGQPAQIVGEPWQVTATVHDLRGPAGAGDRQEEARQILRAAGSRPFDLAAGRLLRADVVRTADDEQYLLVTVHHIVADGWSEGVLAGELRDRYAAALGQRQAEFPELPVQYADFAVWQRGWLTGERLEGQLDYWRERLTGVEPLELPTDHLRPAVVGSGGATHTFTVPADVTAGLKAAAADRGASLFMVLLSVFQLLLSKYSGQQDIAVGTPIAGRNRAEIEELVGFFVNTLVMRTDLSGDPAFTELLERVKETALGAYDHQDLPFERIVEELAPERDLSRNPLFQTLLVLQAPQEAAADGAAGAWEFTGTRVRPAEVKRGFAKFDLTVNVTETPDGLSAALEYRTDLFEPATAERLAGHFRTLLAAVAATPGARLSELDMLTPAERTRLLTDWNDTSTGPETATTVHRLVAEAAERHPELVAVATATGGVTYHALDERANQLAHHLRSLGIGPGRLVAVCLDRSPDMIAALLGVLKAGAAYVPLDPGYPADRLAYMVEDSAAPLVITETAHAHRLPAATPRLLADTQWPADRPATEPDPAGTPEDLAYVIYTSGSTGRPKGVQIRHHSLVNLMRWTAGTFGITAGSRVALLAGVGFDAAAWELWPALAAAATCCVTTEAVRLSPALLQQWLTDQAVRGTFLPTPMLEALAALPWDAPTALEYVLTGGDLLRLPADVRLPFRVVNNYGPTESTVVATSTDVVPGEPIPPIGRPIRNTEVYVVDRYDKPVPVGVPGELLVGGTGLALGYLNQPELTARKFTTLRLAGATRRVYRTGDLARWLPDGRLEFAGRIDDQVKLRGYRIEPGEIEATLLTHDGLAAATVTIRDDGPGGRYLAAYTVPAGGTAPTASDLRAHLRLRLPDHMVPTTFTTLDALPLTPNGKVDRKALPAPDARQRPDTAHTPPRTAMERAVTAIWTDILGVDGIGVHDDFFELGGHSLLATQVTSRIRADLGTDVPVRTVFTASTPARLAAAVESMGTAGREPITPAPRDGGPLPLSFAQQRLWFLDQLEPGSAKYSVPIGLRVRGRLDTGALGTALTALAERHEILRTRFAADDDGRPAQIVDAPRPLAASVHDLRGVADPGAREERARGIVRAQAALPFDLTAGPLLRADVVRLADDDQYLLLTVHHIVADGWSEGILARELREFYTAAATGTDTGDRPGLPVQYADFAVWQRDRLTGEVLDGQLDYWREHLAHLEPLELPTDHRRPAEPSGAGDTVRFTIPADVAERAKRLSGERGASLFMTLLSTFQLLLSKYSGQQDIAVGTPIAGRNRAEIEGLIGFFVNTLVLRTDLAGDPAFTELLDRVKDTALGGYDHQDLPFERLVDELAPTRDLSRNPLFQTMLVLQNAPEDDTWTLPGLTVEPVGVEGQQVKFDLQLTLAETAAGLEAALEYRTDLFEPATAERLAGHFRTLLSAVTADPGAPLSTFDMLTGAERQQLVVEVNATSGPYPDTATIHGLIEERVRRCPDAVAVSFGGVSLSYREVNERANALAWHLRERGVVPDQLVAVCLDRGPELVCALLGILKAGAAFVPLDPDYPTDRITFMVEDTATPLVVTQSGHSGRLPVGVPQLLVDVEWPSGGVGDPVAVAGPDDLAYVIYTSGSTGRPKGVQLDHRGVVNYLDWCDRNYPPVADNGVGTLLYSSVTFDLTITALFLPLIQGQRIVVPVPGPDRSAFDAAIELVLSGMEIGFLKATPSHLEVLTAHLEAAGARHAIATVVAGGEDLSPTLADRVFRSSSRTTVISNEYGATEGSVANVMSLTTTVDSSRETTSVGVPITNTTAYVVDRYDQPVPIGVPGECLLGGICVARGYLNRPELTDTRFVPDPFSTEPGARVYRTGDLVRWRTDGQMEFIGRIDNQVKLRGYRIELGEIDNTLLTHPGVSAAAVVVREDAPGEKRLVAYLVPASSAAPTEGDLRAHLLQGLPDYMVPAVYVTLDQLPLTPNGKVDRKALPAPDGHRPDIGSAYAAPRDAVEQALAEVWSEVLGIDTVGIHDNFFELGGDSIISIQMIARAKKSGVHLTPRMIFKHQTIAEIALQAGNGCAVDAEQGKVTGDVPLTPIQHWFFEKDLPDSHHFNQAELLAADGLDPQALRLALGDLTEHHDALRLRYTNGAGGWSQHLDDSAGSHLLDVHDLSDLTDEAVWPAVRGIGDEVQRSLDPHKGPVLRCALMDLGPARGQRLLIAVHHLTVDSVSWRILLEDLGSAYEQRAAGTVPRLPAKTTSFKAWAEHLARYAGSAEARAEAGYWSEPQPAGRLPRDRDGVNAVNTAASVSAALTVRETGALLRDIPRAFNTRINDALLTALAGALSTWTGRNDTLIGLEGHGREDLFPDVDLSRTVGWFTSVFPVALRLDPADGPAAALTAVRDQLDRVPNKGVGYGILRYLGAPDTAAPLGAQPTPEVNFNYLGQFTEQLPGIGRYAAPGEPKGDSISPDGMRWSVLDVTAAVEGDTFTVHFGYSRALHERRTVERLADDMVARLRGLISESSRSADAGRSSEGTPLTGVSDTDMAAILKRFSA
ncbi:amino acid adenylation domain-containing protein [Streptomyces sp. SL13]|uniref:Amino acid adenylation domain-containing protein n=1 Tax=Streptantibioticus silvisoli TaxID=2705255 RepID=A0AA90H765_9ACTN|nr:non-ribosomal peptide synthetase [Streptantibioticus silvisoli]MDI5972481.1 amino acid adenylation domain-containing protein [Streptantibioticus silvisoli]